ncbi:MAG: hypothetical protein DRJ56_05050 [Thermoprotei archaeon]|nr:MAG: hypothetical protein DRJ56_05050 [Thermoprotei archaeon]
MRAIELRRVVKRYGRVVAVGGVTHSVDRGEVHVLLGPNGSGKTTLLKIVCGIVRPSEGEVLVLGRSPFDDPDVKASIGYSPQEPLLYGDLTGFENAILYATLNDAPRAEAVERIRELAKSLGIGEWFFKRHLKTYSGGMMRKASIVAALAHDPEVVVLDEPTSGLDPDSRRALWSFVAELKEGGKAVLVATHLFEDAEAMSDRVVIMSAGRKVAEGSPEQLKRSLPCSYAVEMEFVSEPPKSVVDAIASASVEGRMLRYGLTFRIYVDDPSELSTVQRLVEGAGVRALRLEAKSIGLDDVYFMVTGRALGGGEVGAEA